MPSIARITNTFFVSLINRLGIRPPFDTGFEISNVVQPVSIVDSDISLVAQTSPQIPTVIVNGTPTANPGANTLLADTGAILQAGTYWVRAILCFYDTAIMKMAIQHRNAANSANIEEYRIYNQSSVIQLYDSEFIMVLAASERIRVTNLLAGSSGESQASLQYKLLF